MKTKLKDIKEDFYAFSSKTSDISRQLGLAGIAIIWLFKTGVQSNVVLPRELIEILRLLVRSLLFDFCHAFVPSIVYGVMNNYYRVRRGKSDEEDVTYSTWWTLPEWAFFVLKIFFLVSAYVNLLTFLQSKLIIRE